MEKIWIKYDHLSFKLDRYKLRIMDEVALASNCRIFVIIAILRRVIVSQL